MNSSVHETEKLLIFTLLQIGVIIGTARLMHVAFRRLGQPGVIGEIIAGLILGPSLLGHFFPLASLALFGAKASIPITIISQIGLILLMFQIGTESEFGHLRTRRNRRAALAISTVSVVVPFAFGFAVGKLSAPILAPGVDPVTYSLFFGVGLAITAVPVLGRILRQYDLTRTEVGVVAISAAAVNDVVGWLLLACISSYAVAQFSAAATALQICGLVLFIAALWFVMQPLVNFILASFPIRAGELSLNLMAITICLLFAMAVTTYELGIFAIFGGLAAGVLFHRDVPFVLAWRRHVGQFVLVFFLPVFFTFTGLRTNVLGLTTVSDFAWLTLVLAVGIFGKTVPVYIVARLTGFNRNQSTLLGSMMNTRGLMELIVLNVGYDLGFIPQKVFTMLVIMAVVTTVMTGPLLEILLHRTNHGITAGIEA
jgi:Kef-type K+ transport system membrane component KefB